MVLLQKVGTSHNVMVPPVHLPTETPVHYLTTASEASNRVDHLTMGLILNGNQGIPHISQH